MHAIRSPLHIQFVTWCKPTTMKMRKTPQKNDYPGGGLINLEKCIQILIGTFLTAVFVYWSVLASLKYYSQPVSTEVRFQFGDDNLGNITFPAFSLCPTSLKEIRANLNCSIPRYLEYFDSMMDDCLSATSKTVDELLESAKSFWSQTPISFAIQPGILFGTNASMKFQDFWSLDLSPRHGFCWTFDHSRVAGYETLPIYLRLGHPYIEVFFGGSILKWVTIYLHSGYDLPDYGMLYPSAAFDSRGMFFSVSLTKKILKSVSTRNDVCDEWPKITCAARLLYGKILKRFGCETYYIANGTYLNDLRGNRIVPFCNKTIHEEIKQSILFDGHFQQLHDSCTKACTQYMYSMLPQTFSHANWSTTLKIQFADPNVEVNQHSIAYDYQSLIGEVGGTLGITLGLSGLSIVSIILTILRKCFE